MPTVINAQSDFSAGQPDITVKRNEQSKLLTKGARQMENWRILNSPGVANRPGRRALFMAGSRVAEIEMAPGVFYYLVIGNTTLVVFDSDFQVAIGEGSKPWTDDTADAVTWAVYRNSIYIAFTGMIPRILTWDGATSWSASDFDFFLTSYGRKLEPFYRFAAPGITMGLSALSGAGVTVTFSAAVLTPSHVNVRFRYYDRQIKITGYTSPTVGTCSVMETLRPIRTRRFTENPVTNNFNVGDIIENIDAGNERLYVATTGAPTAVDLVGIRLSGIAPSSGNRYFGPNGDDLYASQPASPTVGAPIVVWDEELVSAYRGYPGFVGVDQNRLIFANFPALPGGVIWSAVGIFDDFEVGADPNDAIFELVPDKGQVLYVVAGAESSEFIFCSNSIWYLPISASNPLKPGSVQFISLSKDGCALVQPRPTQEFIAYVPRSGNDVAVILPIGQQTRPYTTRVLTDFHAELFTGDIRTLAVPGPDSTFPERYIYALNDDGTIVVGRMTSTEGRLNVDDVIGWAPWSGSGSALWVSARQSNVLMVTSYAPNGISATQIVEALDIDRYLDASILVNNPPTGMQAQQPAGTNFGDMTGDGGLAAAFNGVRSKLKVASATRVAASGYVGRAFTTPQVIGIALVWPSTDSGFSTGGASLDVTLELYGKNGVPASATDGTLLATVTVLDTTTDIPVVLLPVFSTTTYSHGWVRVIRATGTEVYISQLLMQTGPLWWMGGGTVELMDQGHRHMGTYAVNSSGNIVPQNLPGENLLSATLIAGQKWTATLEPYLPPAPGGQDVNQRMWPRRVSRVQVHVQQSTGFKMQRLYSGQTGPNLPAPGTVMKTRTIAAYVDGDVTTAAPTLREQAYHDRPLGRSHDPRWRILKDTPGPLTILDIDMETTV